jgi:flagellar biosynthesis protein FliQ
MSELVQEGFSLVIEIAVPMLLAALVGVLAAAGIARAFGIQDAAMGLLTRAIAVIAAITILGAGWAASVTSFTRDAWSGLAALGRGAP